MPAHLARFARTHANWETAEDELVALADKVWKGKRVDALEQAVAKRIAAATRVSPWEVFMTLDALLTRIADGADARLQRSR